MAQMVKNPPALWETWVWSLGWEDSLEKGMATHSSVLSWRIPRTKEPGRLSSMGQKEWDTTEWLWLSPLVTLVSLDSQLYLLSSECPLSFSWVFNLCAMVWKFSQDSDPSLRALFLHWLMLSVLTTSVSCIFLVCFCCCCYCYLKVLGTPSWHLGWKGKSLSFSYFYNFWM